MQSEGRPSNQEQKEKKKGTNDPNWNRRNNEDQRRLGPEQPKTTL